MTSFIDAAIFMYTVGTDHPLREPSRRILTAVSEGELEGVTSVEVVQEVLHRYRAIGRAAAGVALATEIMDLCAPVLPVTHAVMRLTAQLATRYPALSSRDLVHVATCVIEGIGTIITADAGFDQVTEVRRIDPREFTASG